MLIRGGTVVSRAGVRPADVLVVGGTVAEVGPAIDASGAPIVDATGMLVLPGVVDPHTHFVLDTGTARTVDDFESASRSAVAGGVTTYLDFAPQQPAQDFLQALVARRSLIEGRSLIDYGIHLNITHLPDGWETDLDRLVGAGVTSAKVYTTYRDTIFYVNDWTWFRLMERSGSAGLLVQVHAENDAILEGKKQELMRAGNTGFAFHGMARPAVAEMEAVSRGLLFSRLTGSPVYFVHLSCPESVDLVVEARERKTVALAETCPHFLTLDESGYTGPNAAAYLMTPPLRDLAAQTGLWQRVTQGLVQTIGSDHCGFALSSRMSAPDFSRVSAGVPGVETALALMHTFGVLKGRIDLGDLVRLLSANPARVFGLWPRKGDIASGFDADIAVFDPAAEWVVSATRTLHSRSDFSPYEGMRLRGRVVMTICRGVPVYRDGRVIGEPGFGQFLPRQPFDPTCDLR